MTEFRYTSLDMQISGTDEWVSVIPEEYLVVHAFLLWEREGKPLGKHQEHYESAQQFFNKHLVVPTEDYLKLQDMKYKAISQSWGKSAEH